jgi:hypothetical protein
MSDGLFTKDILLKNRNTETLIQLNILCVLRIYFYKKERSQIQCLKEKMCSLLTNITDLPRKHSRILVEEMLFKLKCKPNE